MIKKFKTIPQEFRQFFKYCLVGISGTLIDLISLYIFVEYVGIAIIPAAVLSFLLAVTNNFTFNKKWTFKSKSRNIKKLYIKFLIVSTVGLGLTIAFMYVFVNILEIWYMLAKVFTSIVVLTWNFLGNKTWTFKLKLESSSENNDFKYDLSIVVPAYNEENRIKSTLLIIDDYINSKKINAEIIVVDDGSKDNTTKVVEKYKNKIKNLKVIRYEKNQGKGFAVKTGVEASKGKYVLFADADNSTPIEEYEKLQRALMENNAEISIGSRYLKGSNVKIKQPKHRIFISRVGNFLIQAFLIDNIKDTQCGFKLFTSKAAKDIFKFQKVKRFAFDMELLVIAQNLDHKIIEVPVSWFNSAESRVRPIRDGLRSLKDLVYIKLNLWSGRYSND